MGKKKKKKISSNPGKAPWMGWSAERKKTTRKMKLRSRHAMPPR